MRDLFSEVVSEWKRTYREMERAHSQIEHLSKEAQKKDEMLSIMQTQSKDLTHLTQKYQKLK